MRDDFRIGFAPESMPSCREVGSQFAIVVYLTIECDDDAAIFVRQGLVPGIGEVDDRETRMREDAIVTRPDPDVVGAAMTETRQHSTCQALVSSCRRVDDACNSAHGKSLK